jgi:hypothetical protein
VLLVLLAAVLCAGLSSCVSLPRSGSVGTVKAVDRGESDALVDFTPPAPKKGSSPTELVSDFLDAMTATPLNTFVAREYLSSGSSTTWVPERGTIVYGSRRIISGAHGHLTLHLDSVVALDDRGAWLGDPTHGAGLTIPLTLVREGGQWRIDDPLDRLLVPATHFQEQYQQYFLYFFDMAAQVLVPEPVYLPRGPQASTLLVAGLLKGPESSLVDTEQTFVPHGTVLDGISVPISRDGTAEIPLSDQVLDLGDDQLNLVFAQLSWTLGQIPGVERMRVTVGGTPIDLPGSRLEAGVGEWTQFDPAVAWASTALFGLRDRRVVTIEDSTEHRVTGAFGVLPLGVRSIGVDLSAQHIAGITSDGRKVLEADREQSSGQVSMANVHTVYADGTDLLRPEYDLYGQLWLVDRGGAQAEVSVVRAGTRRVVRAPGISGLDVTRFVLSRDGTRVVAQVHGRDGDRILVARVRRDASGRVRAITPAQDIALPGAGDSEIRDIGWRTPGSLAVLVGPSTGTSQVVIVKVDGSSTDADLSSDAEVFRDQAVQLTSSPALGATLYIGTRAGQLFSLGSSGRWTGTSIRPGLVGTTYVG